VYYEKGQEGIAIVTKARGTEEQLKSIVKMLV
jgi:hypothetical protein